MSDTAQNSQQAQSEAISAPRQRKSRKPQAIKTAVIAKRANGENITSIANDLGITRNTTRGIIAESDIDRHLQTYQHQSMELIPEALRVMRVRLQANSE